jgi:hypothetical protein
MKKEDESLEDGELEDSDEDAGVINSFFRFVLIHIFAHFCL